MKNKDFISRILVEIKEAEMGMEGAAFILKNLASQIGSEDFCDRFRANVKAFYMEKIAIYQGYIDLLKAGKNVFSPGVYRNAIRSAANLPDFNDPIIDIMKEKAKIAKMQLLNESVERAERFGKLDVELISLVHKSAMAWCDEEHSNEEYLDQINGLCEEAGIGC